MTAPTNVSTTALVEPEERQVFVRSFAAELAEGDGRTIDARIVPYNVPALVADPPDFRAYREMFMRGAFERQVGVPDRVRVWLNFEHDPSLRGIVGHGVSLTDGDDGLYGSFRVHENPDGDKALHLVREKVLTDLSLEFVALRSRTVDGVVRRLRAHIDRVALCRQGAYGGAEVLAVRAAIEVEKQEEVTPAAVSVWEPAVSAEMTERLAQLGVEPLRRMATTSGRWDGSAGRFTDEQYQRSTLLCRPGDEPPKQRCSLPVLEPDGTLNVNALGAAAAALAGARGGLSNVSREQKAAAARKLIRYYNQAKQEPPESLRTLARS